MPAAKAAGISLQKTKTDGKSIGAFILNDKKVIEEYKEENPYEWDTNTVIDVACEYLKTEGYEAETTSYDYCIEF